MVVTNVRVPRAASYFDYDVWFWMRELSVEIEISDCSVHVMYLKDECCFLFSYYHIFLD